MRCADSPQDHHRRPPVAMTILLMGGIALMGACSVGKSALVEQYRAMAQDRLRALDRIMADARTRPPLQAEDVVAPDTEVVFRDVLNEEPTGNAAMIFLDRYTERPAHVQSFYDDVEFVDRWWLWPRLALRGEQEPLSTLGARTLRQSFEGLADVRFVLVLRRQEWEPPVPIEEEVRQGYFRFTRGRFVGEALLYELVTGRCLGGVFVAATSRDQVTNLSGVSLREALQRDLLNQVQQAALLSLARHLPVLHIPRLHR